ncbi:hypothetical protein EES47_21410 [Streptomyces sp. ADI98-12]|nr:hypothetical protein EES47_21410 [Streptomyces sp. ADI98-12]
MAGGRTGGAGTGAGDAQSAVEVVDQGGGDQREHHRGEAEAQQEAVPRQVEGVERDVLAELRVLLTEGDAVDPQQPGPPLPGRRGAGDESDHGGDADEHPLLVRRDAHPVAVEALLLQRHGAERWAQPVCQPDVHPHRERHQESEDEEQADLGPQRGGEDGGEVDRPVPEPVRPESGEHDEEHGQYGQHAQRHEQGPGAPGRSADSDPRPRGASAAVRHLESQGAHLRNSRVVVSRRFVALSIAFVDRFGPRDPRAH